MNTAQTPARARCQGTTAAGQPCQNSPSGTDAFCEAHRRQALGIKPSSAERRVISTNSSHRTMINKARVKWLENCESPSLLARRFGGNSGWWGKIVTRADVTPKFLHSQGIARLSRYLDGRPTPQEHPNSEALERGGPPIMGPVSEHERTFQEAAQARRDAEVAERNRIWPDGVIVPKPELPRFGTTLDELHEEWRKSQEVVSDAEELSALQANVHDLSVRLVKLESMVAEILQTLTEGAS